MTQRSNTTVLEDGTVVPFVARMGGKKPGGSRKGYHAGDLLAAMTGAEESTPWPTVEKPKVLIESIRVVGPDDLTARDQAVYEFLLATARAKGMEKEKHTVPLKKVMEYLDVDSVERVVESLDRIARTVVKYDLRDDEMRRRGWLHLIQAEVTEDLGTGKADLT